MAAASTTRRVLTQIEFYFSDRNLAMDKFFIDLLAKSTDGYVLPLPQ